MKKTICPALLFCIIFFSTFVKAQNADHPCNMGWGEWKALKQWSCSPTYCTIYISFNLRQKCSTIGFKQAYYKIKNEYLEKGGRIDFSFNYKDGEGNTKNYKDFVALDKTGIIFDNNLNDIGDVWEIVGPISTIYTPSKQKELTISAKADFDNAIKTYDANYNRANSIISNISDFQEKVNAQQKLANFKKEFSSLKQTAQENINLGNGNELANNVTSLKQINSDLLDLNLMYDHREQTLTNNTSVSSQVSKSVSNKNLKIENTSQATLEKEQETKRIKDSINRANTDARVAATNSAVTSSNTAMGGAAIGVIGLASIMKDEYSEDAIFCKIYLGLGWDQIPLIANDTRHATSSTEVTSHPVLAGGLKFGFFNNKGISLHINPTISYGLNAILPGTTGSHLSYGGNAILFISPKPESKIRLFAEGGYTKRSGDWTYDQDAAASSIASTYSNVVKTANYDYSVIRYGGGLMLHFIDIDEESYIKPGIFFEKPSFIKNNNSTSMVANLQVLVNSFVMFDLSYSKNYIISGAANYFSIFSPKNQDFFSIRIVKSGKLF